MYVCGCGWVRVGTWAHKSCILYYLENYGSVLFQLNLTTRCRGRTAYNEMHTFICRWCVSHLICISNTTLPIAIRFGKVKQVTERKSGVIIDYFPLVCEPPTCFLFFLTWVSPPITMATLYRQYLEIYIDFSDNSVLSG